MAACTILATNYLAMARVLVASFAQHHPGQEFFTLLIDGEEADRSLPGLGTVVLPGDLVLPEGEWRDMATIYTVIELATAAKPAMLSHLLDRDATAMYLDPDIVVYQPLWPCFEAAAARAIALTPHCLAPVPRDGLSPSETMLMHAGIFNLGFIAVGQRARPFLHWWRERLRHDAVVDIENALFTDQRWIDWVPALFEHMVLSDPGLNVAYWNIHERALNLTATGVLHAGASPVSFFHFSGYDPSSPWRLSKHAGEQPRVRFADHPLVEDLCADYASRLGAEDHDVLRRNPYRLDTLPNGFRLTPSIRRVIRTAHLADEDAPNPYTDSAAFVDWLDEPVSGTATFPFSRWDMALWQERPDLRAAFPDPGSEHASVYHRWLTTDPWPLAERVRVFGSDRMVQKQLAAPRFSAVGWSVIAYADAELGVGEAGRRLARAVQQVGLPNEVVGVGENRSRREHKHGHDGRAVPSFDNSITCVNADQLKHIWHKTGLHDQPRRGTRVGLWFWETDRVPERLLPAFGLLDEIWVVSDYTKRAFDRIGLCPVELVTLPVVPRTTPTPHTRRSLGLPEDQFVFTCSYDFFSVLPRKNPLGVIEAYTQAFGPDDGACLVLKSINGDQVREDLAKVERAARRRPDIHVVDGYRTAGEVAGLLELSDCVVSLHRSEGYGLNLIDAMAVGTPVVATGYSGNLAFMDEGSAFLVPYEEVLIGPGADPYPPDGHWAEPDLNAAAGILRAVFDDPASARARGRAGQAKVLAEHSLEVAGDRLRDLTVGHVLEKVGG